MPLLSQKASRHPPIKGRKSPGLPNIGVVAQKARSPDGDRASLAMDGLTA
jgi:hypothetical protein